VKELFKFTAGAVRPDPKTVLARQGIPPDSDPPQRILDLLTGALALFDELAEPRGIQAEISKEEFLRVYAGEGRNETPAPLERIVPGADHLALFVVTVGEPISRRIDGLFQRNDPALGFMLDSAASEAADKTAELAARRFLEGLMNDGRAGMESAVLPYSPGYCGWHVSGQKKLFVYLAPEKIGVTLNSSYLMQPLKSVSGVLVAGRADIHAFDNSYPFCETCRDRQCRARIRSVAVPGRGSD
jgi:hypothetical protein